jgi:hypothetical protein
LAWRNSSTVTEENVDRSTRRSRYRAHASVLPAVVDDDVCGGGRSREGDGTTFPTRVS